MLAALECCRVVLRVWMMIQRPLELERSSATWSAISCLVAGVARAPMLITAVSAFALSKRLNCTQINLGKSIIYRVAARTASFEGFFFEPRKHTRDSTRQGAHDTVQYNTPRRGTLAVCLTPRSVYSLCHSLPESSRATEECPMSCATPQLEFLECVSYISEGD